MEWTVISAVNDDEVLKSSLLDSPGLKSASQVILQRGFKSASLAYNDAINKAQTDLLVFMHQDMYLPEGWIESVERTIETLATKDPDWGVLGVWGAEASGHKIGYLYWTGDAGDEAPFEGAREVRTLDEVVLIFRKSSGLKFDELLPSYHFYGADICLEAARLGKKSYAISAFCIHNTNVGGLLPWQFWKCYFFMRRKWMKVLPIETPCASLTFSCRSILEWHVFYFRDRLLGRRKPLVRAAASRELHRELIARGRAKPFIQPGSQTATQMLAKTS